MAQVRCPVCQAWFEPEQSDSMPFCSKRCRTIDLGRWLGEAYAVPVPKSAESPDSSAPAPDGEEA